ncbi:hypothetical protein DFH09DRAFT_1328209 [Mycena vulgaris]|nr:hypothetical protein DFH09DRAFT_1328209 [Mycena vulgaris]
MTRYIAGGNRALFRSISLCSTRDHYFVTYTWSLLALISPTLRVWPQAGTVGSKYIWEKCSDGNTKWMHHTNVLESDIYPSPFAVIVPVYRLPAPFAVVVLVRHFARLFSNAAYRARPPKSRLYAAS